MKNKYLFFLVLFFQILKIDSQVVSGQFLIGGSAEETTSSTIQLSNGDYFFCGTTKSFGNGGSDLVIIRFNPDFSIEWEKTVGGVSDDYFNGMTIPIENDDGSLTILAMTNSFGMGQTDILVQNISANGNVIWSKIYGGIQSERSDVIRSTLDGGYIFGGHTDSYNTLSSTVVERDLFLVKIDSIGNVIWSKTMGTNDNNDSYSSNIATQITDIKILQDSTFIIAGVLEGVSSLDASNFISRINSDGTINWFKKYTESTSDGYEVINSILLQGNDNAIASGLTTYGTIGGAGKGLAFSFNINDGSINWSNTYGHTSSSINWIYYSLKETPNKYIMSMYQNGSGLGDFDVSSFAIDSNGVILQQKVFGTSDFDRSINFTSTSDGGYLFSGISGTGLNSDSYLIKVDSSWNTPCNNYSIIINREPITITPQNYNPTIVTSINSSSVSLSSFPVNINIDTLCIDTIPDSTCNNLNFDGVDDYVEVDALATPLSGTTNNFTVEFWMKADLNNQTSSIRTSLFSINPVTNNANGLLIILGGTNTQEGKLMIYDEGTFGTNADFKSSQVIGDALCHHITYVRNGSTGFIYIDGVQVGSHTTTYSIQSTDKVSIGQEWDDLITTPVTSQFYNGDIDELRIWGVSRSQAEIQANMNNELTGNELGLFAYYNFNQGVSGANNLGINSLVDNTPNGLNGNLIDFQLDGSISNWVENSCLSCDSTSCNLIPNFIYAETCIGNSTIFTDQSIDSLGTIVNWQWYFGDGDSIVGIQNPTYSYTNSGQYNVTLIVTNNANCKDSITLSVTINSKDSITQNIFICSNDSIFLGGEYQNTAGVYVDSLQTVSGCDSIVTTNLYINNTYLDTFNISICSGDSIFLEGEYQTTTGVYVDSLQTTTNCDSIITTNLTVSLLIEVELDKTICNGDSIYLEGEYQTTAGIYIDTVSVGIGCDSVITTNLFVENSHISTLNTSICSGDSIFLEGVYQTQAGIYTDSLQTMYGCDSIITTNLSLDSAYYVLQNNSICAGDSILFGGIYYYNSGMYNYSLQTINGCDSIVVLDLTVYPSYQFIEVQEICQGDSIFIGGEYQNMTGTYTDSLQTIDGCDSLIITSLFVMDNYEDSINVNICQGDSIFISGVFQTQAGIYADTLQSINSCDSIITIHLIVDSVINLTVSDDMYTTPCNPVELSVSGGASYTWSPFVGLSCVDCSNPLASPTETITYTVSDNTNGCSSNAYVTVYVEGEHEFFIPNVFTPNNDGQNDGFNLYGNCINSVDKKIFNRWGILLFESTQINESWNGRTSTGKEVPEGTYFYIFEVSMNEGSEEVSKIFKGTVSLLR